MTPDLPERRTNDLMPNVRRRSVVGVFAEDEPATRAVHELHEAGYAPETISVMRRPEGQRPERGAEETHVGAGTAAGVSAGVVLGGVAALAALAIPGLGPVLAAGPIAAVISAAVAGGAVGGLVGSFAGLGIPTEQARRYEEAVRRGGTFLGVSVNDADAADRAAHLLTEHGAQHVTTFTPEL